MILKEPEEVAVSVGAITVKPHSFRCLPALPEMSLISKGDHAFVISVSDLTMEAVLT